MSSQPQALCSQNNMKTCSIKCTSTGETIRRENRKTAMINFNSETHPKLCLPYLTKITDFSVAVNHKNRVKRLPTFQ